MIPMQRPQVTLPRVGELAGRCLRVNPAYRIVAHAEIDPDMRASFDALAGQDDYFGLLVPDACPALGVKAISGPVAALLASVAASGRVADPDEPTLHAAVARLVLDGVLQVREASDYVSGPAALALVGARADTARTEDRIARLSAEALELASYIDDDDPRGRSSWLYAYNTIPMGARQHHALGPEDADIERALGLDVRGHNRRRLDARFSVQRVGMWMSWHRRDEAQDPVPCPYKLYVSPSPQAMYEVFDAIVETMIEVGVASFKLGTGVHGLLRPDKLVAYVEDWGQLRTLGDALLVALDPLGSGVGHGVPFTASLHPDGRLSWGMDPPTHARLPGWGTVESWRLWLTNRLARALVVARQWKLVGSPACRHALARLEMEGVDPGCWLPSETLWQLQEAPI